jgi:OOP family OmpA-OmpF porin
MLFPEKTASFDLHQGPTLPPGWALVSELALRAAADTYSSTTVISVSRLQIRGITNDADKWRDSLVRLERNLLAGMQLDDQVSKIHAIGSLDRSCISLFRKALRGRRIEFPRDGAALSSSASPLLDELVQVAADCPASTIVITGHTDNTGQESGNLALSQARADAVASYMIARGIKAKRIASAGAGSSRPLIDDATPQAHQLNRRIDIELIFP